jgi:hypothetical protein
MSVSFPAILGVVLGALIGGVYITAQRWELRHRMKSVQPKDMFVMIPGAMTRLVFVVVALWLAIRFTNANKYWLTGALVVTYTAPLLVQLKEFISPKK